MEETVQEVLIFSGTSEGRKLAEQLLESQIAVTVSVVTDYGQEVMEQGAENSLLEVHRGRLDLPQMEKLIGSKSWRAVVDATHPFAQQVTQNIAQACANQGCKLWRLLRQADEKMDSEEGGQPELENIQDDEEYEIASDAFDEFLDTQEYDQIVSEEDLEDLE